MGRRTPYSLTSLSGGDDHQETIKKGAWSIEEDRILTSFIKLHGEAKWSSLAKKAGLKRSGKSCRLRWLNYLRPGIKRGDISMDEEDLIIRLHSLLGNRWALIAGRLPGRTDNEIKNYWYTKLVKKLQRQKTALPSPGTCKINVENNAEQGSGHNLINKTSASLEDDDDDDDNGQYLNPPTSSPSTDHPIIQDDCSMNNFLKKPEDGFSQMMLLDDEVDHQENGLKCEFDSTTFALQLKNLVSLLDLEDDHELQNIHI